MAAGPRPLGEEAEKEANLEMDLASVLGASGYSVGNGSAASQPRG